MSTPPPPDPILQFFLTTFYRKTIDPKSNFYLPKLVTDQSSPVVEPYVIGGDWNDLDIGPNAAAGAEMICAGTSPPSKVVFGIPSNGATPVLNLVEQSAANFTQAIPFQLSGLSNMLADPPVVTEGDTIRATATLGVIDTWPIRSLVIQGNFSLEQLCCLSEDGTTCLLDSRYDTHGEGTFVATFTRARVSAGATANVSPDGSTLTVTVNELGFSADPADLSVSIVIYSIDNPKWRDTYSKTAEQLFQDKGTKASIIDQIAQTLDSPDIRSSFQNVINNALANLFGGGIV